MKKSTIVRAAALVLATVSLFTIAGCKKKNKGKGNTDGGGEKPAATEFVIPSFTAPPLPHLSTSETSLVKGNRIAFGSYEQDNDNTNGKEAIEWTVAYTFTAGDKKRVYLISNECLFVAPYSNESDETTWAESSLRAYLNNEFYSEAFDTDEQGYIYSANLSNLPNSTFPDVDAGPMTSDNVFIPSYADYGTFFDWTLSAVAEFTPAAKAALEGIEDKDSYVENSWWMRNPGSSLKNAMVLNNDGEMVTDNGEAVKKLCGVRVGIWVEVDGINATPKPTAGTK